MADTKSDTEFDLELAQAQYDFAAAQFRIAEKVYDTAYKAKAEAWKKLVYAKEKKAAEKSS